MSSTDENKQLLRRYYEEVLNKGDVELLDELATANYIENDPLPGQGEQLDGLKGRVKAIQAGLDPKFIIEDMIAEGDKVVVRWTNSGIHKGDFLGMPPTGKSFTIPGIDIHRLENGKMAEHWHVVDQLGQLMQLGIISLPG
jgi:steroid delta-isomerase-like uncharacterized protein